MSNKIIPRLMRKELYEFTNEEKLLLQFKNDPIFFAEQALELELAWYQKIILRKMWTTPFILMIMGRGSSKTSLTAIYFCMKAMLTPGIQIGCVSASYRQACLLFSEIDKLLWPRSEYLRASCLKPPSVSNTEAILKFQNGASIKALPLTHGGGKIRGQRFNVIFIDEYAEVPLEIMNLVILPMLAVKRKGMQNQIIEATTARYKWNHIWKEYLYYKAKEGKIPIRDLPEGFIIEPENYYVAEYDFRDLLIDKDAPFEPDMRLINKQYGMMPHDEFAMEFLNLFPDETTGFFPSELILSTERGATSLEENHQILQHSDSNLKDVYFVFGIDSARSEDKDAANFCIQIIKIEDGKKNLCKTITLHGATYQEMIEHIRRNHVDFGLDNVIGFAIDAGGGGTTLKDYLAVQWKDKRTGKVYDPIVDPLDEAHNLISSPYRTIHMYNQTDIFNNNMFHALKADLENRRIVLPQTIKKDPDKELEKIGQEIGRTKSELISIQISETRAGFKFTVPKGLQKDRAVALGLANYDANALLNKPEEQMPELGIGGWI